MPQFDTFSFFSQIFWALSFFLLFFLSTSYYLLPAIGITLKVRKRNTSVGSALLSDTNNVFDTIKTLGPAFNDIFSNNTVNLLDSNFKKEQIQKNRLFPLILVKNQSMRYLRLNFSKKIISVL